MEKKYDIFRADIPKKFNETSILLEHKERFLLSETHNDIPPYEILIHPTSLCNLNCEWCIGKNLTGETLIAKNKLSKGNNLYDLCKQIVSYEKTINIDGKNKIFKVNRVTFSGITGEPLMTGKKLLDSIDYLTKNNIEVGMFTNGLLIDENNISVLSKMNYILISIDAGTSRTYDFLKNGSKNSNNYQKLICNIKKLIEYSRMHNAQLDVNVGFVINKYNYKEILDLSIKLKKIGVHYLRFKTDISSKMNIDKEIIDNIENTLKYVKKNICTDKFKIVEIHRVSHPNDKIRISKKCYINKLIACVGSDCNLYACNYHPSISGVTYGDFTNSSFESVWSNKISNFNVCKKCPNVCDPFKTRSNNIMEFYSNLDLLNQKEFIKYIEENSRDEY